MTLHATLKISTSSILLLLFAGCTVAPVERVYVSPPPVVAYVAPSPPQVVSVFIEPPLFQPPPVVVAWAPPPMLVEPPPLQPFAGAFWVGGYWAWQGTWVWSAGRWAPPPQPGYGWVHPYYENRSGVVVFIGGHWSAPGVIFVPPPPTLSLTLAVTLPGVVAGLRPIGPSGVFVPAPPGSRLGLIIPAPIGTPPAVVIGAPPVTNVGMRIQNRVDNTTINNTWTTNVTNITNVTIVAPAGATASGKAFEAQVPAQAHLAAAQTPVVHTAAPVPASNKPIAAFAADRPLPALPAPQQVHVRQAPSGEPAEAARHAENPSTPRPAPPVPAPNAQPARLAEPERGSVVATPAPMSAVAERREPVRAVAPGRPSVGVLDAKANPKQLIPAVNTPSSIKAEQRISAQAKAPAHVPGRGQDKVAKPKSEKEIADAKERERKASEGK